MCLAMGILAAIVERQTSGKGQVVDAAMIDGVHSLFTAVYGATTRGTWKDSRGENPIDGGAPWYVYETSDGRYVSIGAIEGRFYRDLLERTGMAPEVLPSEHNRGGWNLLRRRSSDVFKAKTRFRRTPYHLSPTYPTRRAHD